jgi:hypothetical protein
VKACGREAGREEVPPAQAPEHGASEAGREAGHEENRRGALLARGSGLKNLVDRAAREPSRRQMVVDGGDPEGERFLQPRRRTLQSCDPRP